MEKLISIIGVLISLSIASERLVEITKGFIPMLREPLSDQASEHKRRSILQVLAVLSGIITAYLSKNIMPTDIVFLTTNMGLITLGLLASGGSAFWNAILTYMSNVKDIKRVEADKAKMDVEKQISEK
ncbi:hypothetical protein NMD21_19410 [Citrobacter portucalensis]|uniref:hypothetical protein n=1 Tax=Citrobacter TaxID=544 RepID=UPI001A31155B|nr:hypothetical protein [Citrobacter sp. Cpo090]MDM2844201.1 hypothetical protein [Citrobacter sp. Cpo090]